jgi:hypothetical protein
LFGCDNGVAFRLYKKRTDSPPSSDDDLRSSLGGLEALIEAFETLSNAQKRVATAMASSGPFPASALADPIQESASGGD